MPTALIERLQKEGFRRIGRGRWQYHHDKPWYCVTVDLRDGDIVVAGTSEGYEIGSRLRTELRRLE